MRVSANNNNIQTTTWNKDLKVGDKLEGQYVAQETFEGKFGMTNKYVIRAADGTDFAVYGSASIDRQFAKIKIYSYVWIEYTGEEKTKNGRTVKTYRIDYDPEYVA